jgi:putative addiction module CopG family antidote
MNVELDPEQQKLAEQLVATGRFTSVKDAVNHALRLLVEEEQEETDIPDWHIDAVREGVAEADAGHLVPLSSMEELLAEANAGRR